MSVIIGEPRLAHKPSFIEAFAFWLKLGFISFGGPTGQIAIMHEELVERKKWISEERFLHALNYCMLLPGPEAQQLAIYIGWLLHGTRGGIVAGVLFVLPSVCILWGLSWFYVVGQNLKWVEAVFHGLKPAVLAIVLVALLRIGNKALKNEVMWSISALAFIAIFFLKLPFPLIIVISLVTGWLGSKLWRERFTFNNSHSAQGGDNEGTKKVIVNQAEATRPSLIKSIQVVFTCLILWWVPIVLVGTWLGWDSIHAQQGLFFSGAAMVTFGGAYAVLPYVAQQAVEKYGWLTAIQMIDGLGLAETTPGPLIMVLQFVGFIGGWQHPPIGWSPLSAATLGALITTWVTFVPCFLWIFLGAPYIEQMRDNKHLSSALSTVTAAVVGVILNLFVWFAWHTIFYQATDSEAVSISHPDWFVIVVALLAFFAMRKWKLGVISVVLLSMGLGLIWGFIAE